MDDDETKSPWDILLEIVLRFGLCGSCHFAPALEGGRPNEPWTCPRCGFLSSDEPENWGPVSRLSDPVGADEPRYEGGFSIEDEDTDDEAAEPDFPIFALR